MAAQGADPNPPKAPRSKSPREAAEEEGDEVQDADVGSEDEDAEGEEEEEKPLKKRKGETKAKKEVKCQFMLHGPAKGGLKAVRTKETLAEVNARSRHLEQLYQRSTGISKDEYSLSTTEAPFSRLPGPLFYRHSDRPVHRGRKSGCQRRHPYEVVERELRLVAGGSGGLPHHRHDQPPQGQCLAKQPSNTHVCLVTPSATESVTLCMHLLFAQLNHLLTVTHGLHNSFTMHVAGDTFVLTVTRLVTGRANNNVRARVVTACITAVTACVTAVTGHLHCVGSLLFSIVDCPVWQHFVDADRRHPSMIPSRPPP